MSRGPLLDTQATRAIADAVRGMPGAVTWASVVHVAAVATGHAYTRQALAKHPCVLAAVRERRAGGPDQAAGRRRAAKPMNSLRAELEQVKAERWKLEEQLILIAENAYALGISEQLLLQPGAHVKSSSRQGGRPPAEAC